MEKDAPIEAVRTHFATTACDVVAAYVFGSVARGRPSPRSDLDVAVLFRDSPPRTLQGLPVELEADLQRATGRPVDLVVLNHAPADLVHRVLRDGVLVYESDRSARIRFEVRSRNEYFDLLPVLREYRRPRVLPEHPR